MAKSRRARQGAKARAKQRSIRRAQAAVSIPTVILESEPSDADIHSFASLQPTAAAEGTSRHRTLTAESAQSSQTVSSTVSGTSDKTVLSSSTTSSDDSIVTVLDASAQGVQIGVAGIDDEDADDDPFEGSPYSRKSQYDIATVSLYDPSTYRCTGYNVEDYIWHNGSSDLEDRRFVMDLEYGSMDHLADVRPYLYHVGFWSGDWSGIDIKVSDASVVEDRLVRAGRRYLQDEREKGFGYFLAHRDLPDYDGVMPFQLFLQKEETLPGDVGVSGMHPPGSGDGTGDVVKTNIRTPLPDKSVCKFGPGHPRWDEFIVWLYSFQVHPVVGMLQAHWTEADCQHERYFEGRFVEDYFVKSDSGLYPNAW